MLIQTVITILTASLQKAMPILVGMFVIRAFGEKNYTNYSFLLVFLSLLTTLISAGMIPALIRRIALTTKITEQRKHIHTFLITACFLWLIGTLAALSFSKTNILPEFLQSNYEIFFLICFSVAGLIVTSISISILQSLGYIYNPFSISVIYSAYILIVILISWRSSSFIQFIFLYLFGYMVAAFYGLMILKKTNLFRLNEIRILKFLPSLKSTLGETTSIFLPNFLWMLGVFLFHSFLINTTSTQEEYVWFAMGYQWLTLIVFIPGAIAPLVIPFLLKREKSFAIALKLSLSYLIIALVFSFFITYIDFIFNSFYGIKLSENSRTIILYVLVAGSFAAGNAPLLQYLFSINKSLHILYAALAWISISMLPSLIDSLTNYYNEVFLFSYMTSYIFLLISGHIVYRTKKKRL